jgi:beta-glucosidase
MYSFRRAAKALATTAALALAVAATGASPAAAAEPWPATGGDESTVAVTTPAAQSAIVGTEIVPFHVKATDSDPGQMLVYTATDLPAGLSMSTVIGSISGTPTTAGTSTVTVTVTDRNGAKGVTSFVWAVAGGAAPDPENGVAYAIRLAGTTGVVSVPAASVSDGEQLFLESQQSGSDPRWTALANPDGTYSFRNEAARRCLDVKDASESVGAAVIQAACDGSTRQRWNLVPTGVGFTVANATTGLAVGAASARGRSPLFQDASGSVWEFIPID